MQILSVVLLGIVAIFFQACGNVSVSDAPEVTESSLPGPGPIPTPTPVPAPTLAYKQMIIGASQCPNSANNTCRTGLVDVDLVSKGISFFDLGPQQFGNQPFFSKVYEQGDIIRFVVSQTYSTFVATNVYSGTIFLVEYNKATKQFKKLFEETKQENVFAYFIYTWGDCNGDGVKDWIHYSGSAYPYKIYCRSSVDGANLKTIYSGGALPRKQIKDLDGDGIRDLFFEGSYGAHYIFGSKTMSPGSAALVQWTLPTTTGLHFYPENFDLDGDGWEDMIDTPIDYYNRSAFVVSGKTGQQIKEIIAPTGEKYMSFRTGRFLPGSQKQLLTTSVTPVSSSGGNILPLLTVLNDDGSKAGTFQDSDYFDSFDYLTTKPACWKGCWNPSFVGSSLRDLDGDGYTDFITNSFSLFSLKLKAGYFFALAPQYYFWQDAPVMF